MTRVTLAVVGVMELAREYVWLQEAHVVVGLQAGLREGP
jgi:hypothetical protein